MNDSPIHTGNVEAYYDNQLVVDSAHLDLVQAALAELAPGAQPGPPVADEGLGLTLLTVDNLADVAGQLRRRQGDWCAAVERRLADQGRPRVSQLDLVLARLRDRFAADYGGWTPTMGKNRVIRGVIKGLPHIGGGPIPTAADAPVRAEQDGFAIPERPDGQDRPVRVGILDTRLYENQRLAGRYLAAPGALIAAGTQPLAFWEGHAAFIAGLVLRRAPGAELDVRAVLTSDDGTASLWEAATRMAGFAGSGVDVLNLSFACWTDDQQPPLVLARAVERLTPQVVVVAAAGNHGAGTERLVDDRDCSGAGLEPIARLAPAWPAALDGVVAVGAVTSKRLGESAGAGGAATAAVPFGIEDATGFTPKAPWVRLLAPGEQVVSTYLEGAVRIPRDCSGAAAAQVDFDGLARWSGTSFAAAAVSGQLAADTIPGRRSAHEALQDLLAPSPQRAGADIKPFRIR